MNGTLPISGLSLRKLGFTDMQLLKDFDELAMFEQNDTPIDHEPPRYTDEELRSGFEKGEITGIFDQGGQMVAYYWLELKPTELYIGGIAVHPDYRNKGIGQFAMRQAQEVALANGRNTCTLTVDPYNGRGMHVYLKDGYQIIQYDRNAFGEEGCVRFHMEKKLTTDTKQQTEERRISVNDSNASQIEESLASGFVGTSIIRSKQGNKENIIVFTK